MKKSSLIPFLVLTAAAVSPAAVVQVNGLFNGGGINHAYGGTASQTAEAFGGAASRAVDGFINGNWSANSVTHSDGNSAGAWEVNMGSTKPVEQIVLWNRTDCCGERLSNFRLGVYDAGNAEVWAQNFYTGGGNVGLNETVSLPAGVSGQYVRVQQLGLNSGGNLFLSLAEVQAMELNPVLFPNVALGKPALQSSTAYGGDAARAVDGNTSGFYGDNSVTHTADSFNGWIAGSAVWWEVDLQGDFQINEIAINGREDCCTERLGNFRVSIMNDGSEVWGQDYFTGASGSNVRGPGLWSTFEDLGGFIGTGDKVRVSLIDNRNNSSDPNNAGTLSLAEVRVFGQAIPEPSAAAFTLLAGLGLLRRRR
jgi:F5/8 type C domain